MTRLILALLFAAIGCNHPASLEVAAVDGGADLVTAQPSAMPFACGTAAPRFSGALCGPASRPCLVRANESVARIFSGAAVSTGGVPEIALDSQDQPWLLMTMVLSGAPNDWGHLAHRQGAAQWSLDPGPLPDHFGAGLLAITPDDALHILILDEASDELFDDARAPSGAWGAASQVSGDINGFIGPLIADHAGCLYSALGIDGRLQLARWNDVWSFTPVLGKGDWANVALSSSGRSHVVGDVTSPGFQLMWQSPPDAAEPIAGGTDLFTIGLTGDQPHVLFTGAVSGELEYATRVAGAWTTLPVAASSFQQTGDCSGPTQSGQSCSTDQVRQFPVAVITSGSGEVRLFYLRLEDVQAQEAECNSGFSPDLGAPGCHWNTLEQTETSQLQVAWLDSGVVSSSLVLDGLTADGARATVDSTGTIQVVTTDWNEIRWIALGP